MSGWAGATRSKVTAVMAAATCAVIVLLATGGGTASGAVTPDSACQTESSFKSTSGTVQASLLIINNTGETLQAFWLDYKGIRVFYKEVAPFTSYVQPTWLTHPWIIANPQGACYRFLVMNSVQQTVTVNPDGGTPAQTASPPVSAPRGAPRAGPSQGGQSDAAGRGDSSGFPALPVFGVLAALLAVLGGLAATGHLPGITGLSGGAGGSGSESVPGMSQVVFDPDAHRYYTELGGNRVDLATQAELQNLLAGAGNPPEGSALYQQTVDDFMQTRIDNATTSPATPVWGSSPAAPQVTFDAATQQYYTDVGGNQVSVATRDELQSALAGVGNPPEGSALYQQTVDDFMQTRIDNAPQ